MPPPSQQSLLDFMQLRSLLSHCCDSQTVCQEPQERPLNFFAIATRMEAFGFTRAHIPPHGIFLWVEDGYKYSTVRNIRMNRAIFSVNERKKLETFVSRGVKQRSIHQLFFRMERYLPMIRRDLELADRAIAKYRFEKRPTGPRPRKHPEVH